MTPSTESAPARNWIHRFLLGDNARFLKFAVVGGSGVFVNEGLLWLFADVLLTSEALDLRVPIANLIAIVVSIFTNFLMNDLWTWGELEKRGRLHLLQRLGKYYLVAAAAAALNFGLAMLFWKMMGLHHLVANLIGIAIATLVNFLIQNRWTFAR
jgi:dolichol-phosphate mannosyltransferase